MSRISISIEGADSAHRHRMRELRARTLPFPDGVERHFMLPRWYWETLERLKVELAFTEVEFTACVWECAQRHPHPVWSFEEHLRALVPSYIRDWSGPDEDCGNQNQWSAALPG